MTDTHEYKYNTHGDRRDTKSAKAGRVRQIAMLAVLAMLLATGRMIGTSESIGQRAGASGTTHLSYQGPSVQRADLLWELYYLFVDVLEVLEAPLRGTSPDPGGVDPGDGDPDGSDPDGGDDGGEPDGGDPDGGDPEGDPEEETITEEEEQQINEGADTLEAEAIYDGSQRVTSETSVREAIEFVELLVELVEDYLEGGSD